MASYNYVGTPNSNLICCICRMPFSKPTTTRTCFHTFCNQCIIRAITHIPQCPVDRSPLTFDDLGPANSIIRALVDELIVECPHRSSGCTITCQRQLLISHLKDACQYTRSSHSESECNRAASSEDIPSRDMNHSEASVDKATPNESLNEEPSESAEMCTACFSMLSRNSLMEHTTMCSEISVPCPHNSNGCRWTGSRNGLSTGHLLSCPYEGIKDFFPLNGAMLSALNAENILLKHKVENLETMVQALRNEMQAVKTALGPWYRPDSANKTSMQSVGVPPSGSRLTPSSSHQSSMHGPAFVPTDGFSQALTTGPDILAPYFPSVTDGSSSPLSETNQFRALTARHRHSISFAHLPDLSASNSSLLSFAYPNYARPISHSSLAPIDLGTTLEGSLRNIRESIVILSASVDSVARQHDLALTNETLKLSEEIMGMKASIHGLRMQVHTIMMDRNAQITGRMNEQPFVWGESRGSIDNSGWSTPIPPRFHTHLPQTSLSLSATKL